MRCDKIVFSDSLQGPHILKNVFGACSYNTLAHDLQLWYQTKVKMPIWSLPNDDGKAGAILLRVHIATWAVCDYWGTTVA